MNTEVGPTERRTQAQRSHEATISLAQAAVEIIAEKGMRGLTLSTVSERAGVSRGLPIYHFGSKAGLINHVLDSAMALRRKLIATGGLKGIDALGEMLDTLPGRVLSDPVRAKGQFILLAEGGLSPEPEIRQRIADYNRTTRDFYTAIFAEELKGKKQSAALDPELLAANYLGGIRGIISQWVLDPENFDLKGAMHTMKHMLYCTLRPGRDGK